MTKLLKAHRVAIVAKVVSSVREPREAALDRHEHALAIRMVKHRYGDDVFERCRALPEGWLPSVKILSLSHDLVQSFPRYRHESGRYASLRPAGSVRLSDYAPLPASAERVAWGVEHVSAVDGASLHDLFADRVRLEEDLAQLERQVVATLASFSTVEALAEGWPEGYKHFPHEALASAGGLPAPRIEDLDARIAVLREAA